MTQSLINLTTARAVTRLLMPVFALLLSGCATTKPQVAIPVATIQVEQLAKTRQSWNGQVLPHYPTGQPEVTILRIVIPPGTKLPMHKHQVINAAVLLKGELKVVSKKGEKLTLKAGDPIVELVEAWHYGMNEGTEPAEIVVFYAGTPGLAITVKQ